MDAATWIIGGAAAGFVGLLGFAASGGAAVNAFGLEKFDWESRWCAYTEGKYSEIVMRAVASVPDASLRLQANHAVTWIYRDMERARESWDADPALPNAHYDFTSAAAWRYNAFVQAVRAGDVTVLSADERARLRMFLEAARAYFVISADVSRPVRVADLARVLCLSEGVVEEVTRVTLEAFATHIADSLRHLLNRHHVHSVEAFAEKVRTQHTRGFSEPSEQDREALTEARDTEADLDELRAQIRRLDLRHVRPLTLRRDPASGVRL